MLPKTHRFNFNNEYDELKKTGKRFHSLLFDLIFSFSSQNTAPRIGIVVSNNVSLLSVRRHLVKRRISEAIFLNINSLPKGTSLVFLVKKEGVGKTFAEIKKEVERIIPLLINSN